MKTGTIISITVVIVVAGCRSDETIGNNNQPICGNGVVEAGEGCDDGSQNSDTQPNACRSDCQGAHCGDGVVDSEEDCDGSDLHGQDCISVGQPSGVLACNDTCAWDITGCTGGDPFCGDGTLDPGESCDDGPANSDVAPDACRTDCTVATCGDGVIDSAEVCDGTNVGDTQCADLLPGHSGIPGCTLCQDYSVDPECWMEPPVIIPGGGVAPGDNAGILHVFVVNAEDDTPLSGAIVMVGEPDAISPQISTTDATGLVTFTVVPGAQVITAAMNGYTAVTWFGANGANATIPLVPTPTQPVETAVITGTIEGWDSMQDPNIGDYRAAVVSYSHTDNIFDPANAIEQPVDGDGLGLNMCLYYFMASEACNWSLITRTGPQIVYAAIVIGDPNGTPSDITDDIITVIGYAALTGLSPSAGQTLSNQTLVQMNDTTSVSVGFGSPPAGLGDVTGIPYIVTPTEGRVPPFLFTPTMATAPIPNLTGPFAGATYDFVGVANTTGAVDTEMSVSFLRDISVPGGVTLPAWLAPPSAVSATGGIYSFTPAPGANVHSVTFADSQGNSAWVVLLLDGRTSFTAPTTPDVMPTGSTTMTVAEMIVPGFDPADFTTPDLATALTHTATSKTTFTP